MRVLVVSNQLSIPRRSITNPVVDNFVSRLRDLGVDTTTYAVDMTLPLGIGYFHLLVTLVKFRFSGESFDIVHIHFGGLTAAIAAAVFHKNLVVSFHGTDLHGGSPTSRKAKIKRAVTAIFSRFAAWRAARTTVVSDNLSAFLRVPGLPKNRCIGTGVSYSRFEPIDKYEARATLGIESQKVYALFSDISGSFVKRRDLADEIIRQLRSAIDIELLVLSKVPPKVVPTYIAASDFVLIVSDSEGSPSIVKEALAMNRPIVSVDVGDVAQFVRRAEGSLLLQSRSPKAAAEEILAWTGSRSGSFNQTSTRERFRKEIEDLAVMQSYMEVYDELRMMNEK